MVEFLFKAVKNVIKTSENIGLLVISLIWEIFFQNHLIGEKNELDQGVIGQIDILYFCRYSGDFYF
jgi:hypothetical protein